MYKKRKSIYFLGKMWYNVREIVNFIELEFVAIMNKYGGFYHDYKKEFDQSNQSAGNTDF